jgi:Ca2+-transporting ATPase
MKTRVALPYQIEADAALRWFESSKRGLAATDAATRLNEHGRNRLQKLSKDPAWLKFLRQFKDLMIILLVVSALLALYLRDIRTGIVLLVIILINTIIGFSQEYKAERLMESLDRLIEPNAHVYRDGELRTIAAELQIPPDRVQHESFY